MKRERVEFIDLAKGVCIIMVVAGHCSLPRIPGLEIARMPLYFILAGLFFKEYGSFREFVKNKFNRLIVPFIFFSILALPIMIYRDGLFVDPKVYLNGIVLTDENMYLVGSIWFLLALFWCNFIFAVICKITRSFALQILIALSLALLGYILETSDIKTPTYIGPAISSLPFFVFGYCVKRVPFLYPNKYDRYDTTIALLLYTASYYLYAYTMNGFIVDIRSGELCFMMYPIGCISAMSILYMCKVVSYMPLISYIGKYSIVILGVHGLFIKIHRHMWCDNGHKSLTSWGLFAVVLSLSVLCIPIFSKYFSRFIGKKDLI